MSEYSVEEVRALLRGMEGHALTVAERASLFVIAAAYADLLDRIKSDEVAVTDEVVQKVANELDELFAVEDAQEPAFLDDVRRILTSVWPTPPAQAAQVDRRVAIRLAQYGVEYAYRHKGWSIEPLQDGCEEHIDSWIAQASDATTAEPVAESSVEFAYAMGWRRAALWANRDDLICDIDSPAFERDRTTDLGAKPRAVPDVRAMADRLMGWRLPDDFRPDCGISFDPESLKHWPGIWPVGTNLFTADQAEQMFRYVLAAAPSPGESA